VTEAVTVRRDGDTFQARMFWLKAARLLIPDSAVTRVAFETGPKSFDDIWVDYAPGRGQLNQHGDGILREHIQCKWHVAPGSYGFAQLADPEFINANSRSLLQRAHAARMLAGDQAHATRFKLLTNWTVDRADPLRPLIGTRSGSIRAKRLFDDSTDRSQAGGIRKLWREHLQLDDEGLRDFAGALAFGQASDTLDDIRDQLDMTFYMAGMRRIPANQSAFLYDDLIFQWMAQGRLQFERDTLHAALKAEGLLAGSAAVAKAYGIKSFEHAIDPLELRCTKVLDLTPDFDERFIKDAKEWGSSLYPQLSKFLLEAAREGDRLRLALDAHATLAFAAGSVLDIKSGRAIELEQRSPNHQIWAADDSASESDWPSLEVIWCRVGAGMEIAVAVGLTHDITAAVKRHVSDHLPEVGWLAICLPLGGPSQQSVRSGRHAADLATTLVAALLDKRPTPRTHLFLAAPNAFTFMLGQRRTRIGPVTLYEFDFEGGRDGGYRSSLSLPTN
jgi:hypothetical protein